MTLPIISADNLGKKYTIRHKGQSGPATELRDVLKEGAKNLVQIFRGQRSFSNTTREEFWALRDVSFEIERGDVVGVIGRNGAGKSTLLKVLSRITEPTAGEVKMRGRVASLLEVGTGFHPELSGRENIYLNGAILGMSRVEIKRKFDEIVAFAEVEKFLDTPVKRYSSGMYVRLAFAVAAHLEPEILIVDEVLAVGDAQFQKKCLGKMGEVAHGGRTVILVSHQMQVVQAITQKALLLDQGQLVDFGPTPNIVQQYVGMSRSNQDLSTMQQEGTGEARFTRLNIDTGHEDNDTIERGTPAKLRFQVIADEPMTEVNVSLSVRNGEGVELFSDSWSDYEDAFLELSEGTHDFEITMPTATMRAGPHWLTLHLVRHSGYVVAALPGIEMPPIVLNENRRHNIEANRWGVMYVACQWSKQ